MIGSARAVKLPARLAVVRTADVILGVCGWLRHVGNGFLHAVHQHLLAAVLLNVGLGAVISRGVQRAKSVSHGFQTKSFFPSTGRPLQGCPQDTHLDRMTLGVGR